jgi:hypothetical protein
MPIESTTNPTAKKEKRNEEGASSRLSSNPATV